MDGERDRRRDEERRKRTRSRCVLAPPPPPPPPTRGHHHLPSTRHLPPAPHLTYRHGVVIWLSNRATAPRLLPRSPSRRRNEPAAASDTHSQRDQHQQGGEDPEQAKKRARLEKLKAWKEQQAAASAAAAATASPAAEPVAVPEAHQTPAQAADDGVNGDAAPTAW